MSRGVRWYLSGSFLVLLALAGCGRSFLTYGEREPWRREAEIACMRSGLVKEGLGVVRITSIDGPGICGATIPLKVAVLGQPSAFGYVDEVRPPAAIPGAAPPRWPINPQSQPLPPAPEPRRSAPVMTQPLGPPQMPSPQMPAPQIGAPMSIYPPSVAAPSYEPQQPPEPQEVIEDDEPVQTRPSAPPRQLPPSSPPQLRPATPAPPALGPSRTPVNATMVELKPTATLACPIVSALDRWIVSAVQPAAMRWFNQPVVEIRQISAYSCRGMNGQPGARISEHAFGNALDIAAFVLADGHRITVQAGWHGTPEEQGFLRDVQAAACDQFTTVLAPGSNRFHYNHIHVDLMRRASGRRICQPGAVSGELVAQRARQNPRYAARHDPPPTRRYDPPFDARNDPFAWRGDRRDVTGSIAHTDKTVPVNPAVEDNDWVEDDGPRPAINWKVDPHRVN